MQEVDRHRANEATPYVSVIMGIYNNTDTLRSAVNSILAQTFERWELIMCDDRSTDESYALACSIASQDNRIRVIRNEQNVGCNLVLNRCIEEARGRYIAIMDSDDWSHPQRLEKQVKILDSNPQYAIVGSAVTHFDENGEYMTLHNAIRPQPTDFTTSIPHAHPSCMMRRRVALEAGLYKKDPRMQRVEDYYFLASIYALGYRGYNIPEALIKYRDDNRAYARRTWHNRLNEVYTYRKAYRLLKLPFYYYPLLLRPILVGLLPRPIYHYLHRRPWLR